LLAAFPVIYSATLAVHLHVGYTDPMHLAPAFGGLAILWTALGLLFPYLAARNNEHELRWDRTLASFRA
jgi:hypothetical protein